MHTCIDFFHIWGLEWAFVTLLGDSFLVACHAGCLRLICLKEGLSCAKNVSYGVYFIFCKENFGAFTPWDGDYLAYWVRVVEKSRLRSLLFYLSHGQIPNRVGQSRFDPARVSQTIGCLVKIHGFMHAVLMCGPYVHVHLY